MQNEDVYVNEVGFILTSNIIAFHGTANCKMQYRITRKHIESSGLILLRVCF